MPAPRRMRRVGAGTVARGRPDIRRRVCGGHSRCRDTATCVHDPGHCELPDGRRRSSSAPGCGSSWPAVHGTLAGRTREAKKNFCCVTTRRRNFGILRCLRRGFGALAAHALRLRVLSFGRGIQAASGLPLRRLPAADLPLAFGVLAIPLVPTPRLVLMPAAFAQADPRARSSSTGTTRALCFNVRSPRERYLPRDSPGRTYNRSSRALVQIEDQTDACQSTLASMKKTAKETVLERRGRRRR